MPIRTPRGRGAAYRSLWQWPLRSPARLLGCVVVAIALGVGISTVAGGPTDGRPGGGPAAGGPAVEPTSEPGSPPEVAAAPPTETPTRLSPVPELTPPTLPASRAPAAALTTATRWTRAWAKPDVDNQRWLAGLRPHTTPEFLGVLSTVDPANVPATAVTGSARPVLVSPSSVRAEVPTDALTVLVLVVETDAGWKVSGYDRADPPAPPGR